MARAPRRPPPPRGRARIPRGRGRILRGRGRDGFAVPAWALLSLALAALGAGAVLVAPTPVLEGSLVPSVGLEPVAHEPGGIDWSDRMETADAARMAELARLVGLTLGFLGVLSLVSLAGLFALWGEESLRTRHERVVRRIVGATRRRLLSEGLLRLAVLALAGVASGALLAVLFAGLVGGTWTGPSGPTVPGAAPLALAAAFVGAAACTLARGVTLGLEVRHLAGRDGRGGLARAAEDAPARASLLAVLQVAAVAVILTGALQVLSAVRSPDPLADRPGAGDALRVAVAPAAGPSLRAGSDGGPDGAGAHRGGGGALDRAVRAVSGLPGVRAAGFAGPGVALALGTADQVLTECGRCWMGTLPTPLKSARAVHHFTTPDTFRILGLAVVAGRGLSASDGPGAEPVAVVSRDFALRNFEAGDPLGRRIHVGSGLERWYRVVGVVEEHEVRSIGAGAQPRGEVYLSAYQHAVGSGEILVEASRPLSPSELERALEGTGLRITGTGSLAALRAEEGGRIGWFGRLWTVLSGLALAAACFGIFSTIRLKVGAEVREIGIRRAVGARRSTVLARYLASALRIGGAGVLLGLWAALFLRPYLPAAPPSVSGVLLLGLGGVAAPLLAATLAGALLPAWRASRASPHEAVGGRIRA